MSLPPGPASRPLTQTLRWFIRPVPFLEECRRRYGESFSVRFVGFERPMVMTSEPALIKAVYANRENGLPPGRSIVLEPILGARSILLLEGAEHMARRKVMLPPFHGERMRAYGPVIAGVVRAEVDRWPIGEPFPLHARTQAVTLEVILRAVFGVTDGARLDALRASLEQVLGQTAAPGVQLLAIAAARLGNQRVLRRFEAPLKATDDVLMAEIAERRADGGLAERDDILSLLLQARFEDGEPMSDRELRDQLMTLLLAGHETTATALAWTFDLLLHHPAALGRLKEEIAAGEEERYLRAVVAESLRLRPVVPLAGRRLAVEVAAGGLRLPAGTDVAPAIYLAHTRADRYPQPYAFRPERFLGDAPETYSWIPYGGGVRRCLGAAFAELEMRLALREIVGRCDLAAVRERPESTGRRNVTLSPRHGMPVVLRARRSGQSFDDRTDVALEPVGTSPV